MRGAPLSHAGWTLTRGVLTVLVVALLCVTLMHLAPGDPMGTAFEGANVPSEVLAAMRAQAQVDRPLAAKVVEWFTQAARGNLGFSRAVGMPVREAIGHALPYTALLVGCALAVGFALGLVVALVQARVPGGAADRWLGRGALALWALPEFVVGVALLSVFSVRLGWLPSSGPSDLLLDASAPFAVKLADRLRHLVLPVITLGVVIAAQVARHQRVALIEAWRETFIRAARARGVSERALLVRHAWRAALGPTVALAGLAFPTIAGGAFIVERIFNWPGMGSLAFQAMSDRDPYLALGCVVPGALLVVAGNTVADLVQRSLDPRRAAPGLSR